MLIGTAANWRRNLRPGTPVRIRLRGKDIQAVPEIVADGLQAAALYRTILTHNPTHGRFAGTALEPDGGVNLTDLRRALSNGTAVVRLRRAAAAAARFERILSPNHGSCDV
ncbi:hypothetical protein OG874_24575 [Nocardia sp. NBC_00565]|uniref:hypothetical protein n=1 Tax=Nocardia sp. NBC_00565 TaxID=2975993 RepID=UPI002E7FD689|nr:hypothetical protein [Nocardia sp. NBC_00565]WUC00081.1 hypothetical protein OG874_24575 [Nocardia sp. NBC_00565]